jgi:hypothetical protein
MSFNNLMRSDVYPASIRQLPWSEELSLISQPLEALRPDLNAACADAFRTEEAMFAELSRLPLVPFREAVHNRRGKVGWSESFRRSVDKIEVSATPALHPIDDGGWRLQVSDHLYDYLEISDEDAARGLQQALEARAGKLVDQGSVLAMPVAPDASMRASHDEVTRQYGGADHMAAVEAMVDRIDALVGPALGLDEEDLAAIRCDMLEDPFLKNIQPRWPGTQTRLHGYRTGLDSSERYN